ncbi:MAG: hypothetical protein L3K24_13140 [Gammaproteobacteria bacterium]|nr:hypothetical protein [Gammaproteobacteria bacterium]
MKNTTICLLFLLFSAGLVAGCSGSNSEADKLTADKVSVSGLVRTPERMVLENVEVYNADGILATSDNTGAVSFSIEIDKASSIRLRKSGYAAQTVMLAINNGRADFSATLGKRNTPVTISADAAIDISGISGAAVSLAAGALVDANGNPVTGDIQLSITPVDVSDDDELGVFPGAFAGTDINGNAAPIIMSYGTVEYQFSQHGNELNLAGGQSATIEIPVFIANHPDGTPIQIGDSGALWYLNETSGQWVQENVGTVVASVDSPTGMALQATVTHFSWWNHDIAPQLCDLTITPSGLPNDAKVDLFARTQNNRPRSGSTTFLDSGTTVTMPRGVDVYLQSTARASDGLYRASTINSCDGEVGSLVLDFTGPESPVIFSLTGRVKPYFILELDPADPSNTRWVLDRNDAIFTWSSIRAETRVLSSDQGHNITLGNATGSTQFPMDLNGSHATQYLFTLTATDDEGNTATKTKNLAYDTTPEPILHQFNISKIDGETAQTATLSWDVEGADSITVFYSQVDGSGMTQLATDPDVASVGATALDLTQDIFTVAGAGTYLITIEFTNQYGTTTRTFFAWLYDLSGGGGDDICGDNGELCA